MPQKHTVSQGETLSEVAYRYGYPKPEVLYHHADNSALREKRKNMNVLHPGDEVVLPELTEGKKGAGTGKKHKFVRQVPTKLLKVKLHDHREPDKFKDVHYKLIVKDDAGVEYRGQLDGDGVLTQKLPVHAREAELKLQLSIGDDEADGGVTEWSLQLLIDHLDPVDEVTGFQARLLNLGYDCGTVDGQLGPRTEGALRDFQMRRGLPVTGEADAATQAALVRDHGS